MSVIVEQLIEPANSKMLSPCHTTHSHVHTRTHACMTLLCILLFYLTKFRTVLQSTDLH